MSKREELKSFIDLAEKFASKELEPEALERDRYPYAPFHSDAWKKAVETGLATLTLPESLGGSGQSMAALCAVIETISAVDAGVGAFLLSQAFAQTLVAKIAPEALAKEIFGDKTPIIAAPIYDLPDDLRTTVAARKDGDSYILDGWAPYLAAAPVADYIIAPAKTSSGDTILALVKKDDRGVVVGAPAVSLGLRQLPASDVGFDGTKVPARNALSAAKYIDEVERFRAPVAALALGVVEGSYEAALDYAKERFQSKKSIVDHDMVRVMLGGMAMTIDTSKPMVEHGASQADEGGKVDILSVQTTVSGAAALAATDGVQLLGGYGYMHEYGQEKRMRDAKQIQAIFGPAAVKAVDVMSRRLAGK